MQFDLDGFTFRRGTAAVIAFILIGTLCQLVGADIYMHSPRGSNDRNCERNANRNNGNRLFDSQNNNAGGYGEICPDFISSLDYSFFFTEYSFIQHFV